MAKMTKMTALAFESVKPREDRFELADDGVKGLRLVVQPSGHKSWAVRYRQAGRLRKYTVGDFGTIDLKDARKLASDVLIKVAAGGDPQAAKVTARRRAQAGLDKEHTFGAIYEGRYLPHIQKTLRPKSIKNIRVTFGLVFLPRFARRTLADITPAECLAAVEKAGDMTHAFTAGRAFFAWCESRLLIERSPFAGLRNPVSRKPQRDRVLTDDEIRRVWNATGKLDLFGPLIKLLLLTGARLREVANATWDEFDLDAKVWTLPAARAKNGREHQIHLSDAAVEILRSLRRVKSEKGYLFTTTGATPVSGHSKAKIQMDRYLGEIDPWVVHDLRRTVATKMASIGIAIPVIERCLNHVSGTFGGLVSVYQHHDFAAERRDAFQRWGEHVTKLVA